MKIQKISISSDLFRGIEIPSGIPKLQLVHWLAVGVVILLAVIILVIGGLPWD